jgi:hypothetical protein
MTRMCSIFCRSAHTQPGETIKAPRRFDKRGIAPTFIRWVAYGRTIVVQEGGNVRRARAGPLPVIVKYRRLGHAPLKERDPSDYLSMLIHCHAGGRPFGRQPLHSDKNSRPVDGDINIEIGHSGQVGFQVNVSFVSKRLECRSFGKEGGVNAITNVCKFLEKSPQLSDH